MSRARAVSSGVGCLEARCDRRPRRATRGQRRGSSAGSPRLAGGSGSWSGSSIARTRRWPKRPPCWYYQKNCRRSSIKARTNDPPGRLRWPHRLDSLAAWLSSVLVVVRLPISLFQLLDRPRRVYVRPASNAAVGHCSSQSTPSIQPATPSPSRRHVSIHIRISGCAKVAR